MLINRFGKLQDYIGSNVIDAFLEEKAENILHSTMIDKLHRLECLDLEISSDVWRDIREIRNHVAHEYPDNTELTAKHLNALFEKVPYLLNILNELKGKK